MQTRMSRAALLTVLSVFIAILSGGIAAGQSRPVTLRFEAVVGDLPFACGKTYPGIGSTRSSVTPSDFRFYVSDVQLLTRDGKSAPLGLEQDGKWQHRNVALIDFEDRSGPCANGTEETRAFVRGTVPDGDYVGVRFTLGVPFDLNHEDATLAHSPLNLSGLFWSWLGGYKFLRVDMATVGEPGFIVHLGSSGCQSGTPMTTSSQAAIHQGHGGAPRQQAMQRPAGCDRPNRPVVTFASFDPAKEAIVADLAALLATTNVDVNQPGTPLGCMSSAGDADCDGIMAALGFSADGRAGGPQTFFKARPGK